METSGGDKGLMMGCGVCGDDGEKVKQENTNKTTDKRLVEELIRGCKGKR